MNKKNEKKETSKKFTLDKVTVLKQENLKTVKGGNALQRCDEGSGSKRQTAM